MSQARLKFLIVDDEPEILQTLSAILRDQFDVLQANSGEESLPLIEANARELVGIISDYNMSGMNGMELRRSMLGKYKDIPFILLSGYVSRDDALAAIDAKISAFESKPFDDQRIVDLVKRICNERESLIKERIILEQIFIEEASHIVEELEPLIMSLESNPSDMDTLNTIFRLVHTIKGSSGVLDTTHIRSYVHKYEDLLSKLKSGAMSATPEVVSALLQGFDVVNQMIAGLRAGKPWTSDVAELAKVFDLESRRAANGVEKNDAGPAAVAGGAKIDHSKDKDSVAVPSSLLDEFMELSGEITVIRNMVNKLVRVIEKERPGNKNVQHLGELLDEMHKINGNMQGRLVETRKVSCTKVFRSLPRTVRDTARALNKQVILITEGETIRVDTALAKVLSDSLTHIVRNSLDHGIESKEKRAERKKPLEGTIRISAVEKGDEIIITIEDDGGGIDRERVKRKAVEKGLYTQGEIAQLSEQAVFAMIFDSGFSTAEKITDVSGRGVGMDMVRSAVQSVKGRIEIESKIGVGTKFILHLPIPKSVLIISSLVVDTCGRTFAIPQDHIIRLLRIEDKKISEMFNELQGGYVLRFESELLPVLDLGVVLGLRDMKEIDYKSNDSLNVLVIDTEDGLYALTVDKILDSEEIVVKSVGKHLECLKAYVGATFMGDGTVGLILNTTGIAEISNLNMRRTDKSLDKNLTQTSNETQEMLVFSLFCHSRYAVPLSMVHRLEEFSRSLIQRVGDRKVIIYNGETMPLVDLSEAIGIELKDNDIALKQQQDPIVVFVMKLSDRSIGFIIRSILDVTTVLRSAEFGVSDRVEIAGTIEIADHVVSIVDIAKILEKLNLLRNLVAEHLLEGMKFGPGEEAMEQATLPEDKHAAENESVEKPAEDQSDQGWGIF